MTKTPGYKLTNALTGETICTYKAKAIALRDCALKNAPGLPHRVYYVLKPNGRKVTA